MIKSTEHLGKTYSLYVVYDSSNPSLKYVEWLTDEELSEKQQETNCTYIPVPEGLDTSFINVVESEEEGETSYSLEVDSETKNSFHLSKLRSERNKRLAECDWTQLSDAPLTDFKKNQWAEYRQTLRDLPENTVNYDSPTWPEEPSE